MLEHGRKIATILAADVVEYSRLMNVDDEGTLAALNVRRTIFERLVGEFGGRVFGSVGDSLMAEFPSAVNAVRCAQAIQQAVENENEPLPADRRMALRIGLNLGDVIEEDATLFGDGVNVAARLQALASPGGILISRAVFEQVKNRVRATFKAAGVRHVKNIPDAVATYEVIDRGARLTGSGTAQGPAPSPAVDTEPQSRMLSRTSIAILPFTNLTGDPTKEYFSDGVTEELINTLTRARGLFKVPARTSALAYKGRTIDVRQIARDLDVDAVLEGSVRSVDQGIRVTAQLVDGRTGHHLWSQSFDGKFEDLFTFQDELTVAIADALTLGGSGLPTGARKLPTRDLEAFQLFLQAKSLNIQPTEHNLRTALELLGRALARDPKFARALQGLAMTRGY